VNLATEVFLGGGAHYGSKLFCVNIVPQNSLNIFFDVSKW